MRASSTSRSCSASAAAFTSWMLLRRTTSSGSSCWTSFLELPLVPKLKAFVNDERLLGDFVGVTGPGESLIVESRCGALNYYEYVQSGDELYHNE